MVKRGGFRGRNRQGGGGGGGGGGQRSIRTDPEVFDKHNNLYEQYYNDLGVVNEDERSDFWAALRRDLPYSFRFTGSKGWVVLASICNYLDQYITARILGY